MFPEVFERWGRRNVETQKRHMQKYPPQIKENVEGYVGVFDIGDLTNNTTKFILKYKKIEIWSIIH